MGPLDRLSTWVQLAILGTRLGTGEINASPQSPAKADSQPQSNPHAARCYTGQALAAREKPGVNLKDVLFTAGMADQNGARVKEDYVPIKSAEAQQKMQELFDRQAERDMKFWEHIQNSS